MLKRDKSIRKLVNKKSIHNENFRESFLNQSLNSDFIILFCVGNSTMRAFHKNKTYIDYTPTSIFQSWLSQLFPSTVKRDVVDNMMNENGFINLKKLYLSRLTNYWKRNSGCNYELKFYQRNKLIDLFFKFLILWDQLNSSQRLWLFKNANVPLDGLILKELRK